MKIKGTSKIISENKKESTKLEEQKETVVEIEQVVSEKQEQENIITNAEAVDLIHQELPKTKFHQAKHKAKEKAKELYDIAKPLINKQVEKHKLLASEAVKKARGLSPHVDKLITLVDESVTYLSQSQPIEGRSELIQETRSPSVFGIWVMIATFGFFMMWAFLAPLDSASHAMGKIILESKKRIIQHPEGGVIKEILVKDGDFVKKGETLILLDDTQLRAQKNQYHYKYMTSLAEVSRLIAERDNYPEIIFPDELLQNQDDPEVVKAMDNQKKVFEARKANVSSRFALAEKQREQAVERKNSLLPQITATDKLIEITTDQLERYKKLFSKGNLQKSDLQNVEGRKAEYESRKGELLAKLAESEHQILQGQIAVENEKEKYFEQVVSELKAAQGDLSCEAEAVKEVNERLNRTVITAPEDGNVSNLSDKLTPRGVLPQQYPLMEIIPQDDKLIIEAKIRADDISVVRVGQVSRVRLTAYRARVVPVLEGKVVSLSSDAILADGLELQTGTPPLYYKARIEIDKDNLKELFDYKGVVLYPGMGVDVMIVVGTRTMMRYLMDPIIISLDHSFREK